MSSTGDDKHPIFHFRVERGWSQKRMAEILGCSDVYVHKLENGTAELTDEKWDLLKEELTPEDFAELRTDHFLYRLTRTPANEPGAESLQPEFNLIEISIECESLDDQVIAMIRRLQEVNGDLPGFRNLGLDVRLTAAIPRSTDREEIVQSLVSAAQDRSTEVDEELLTDPATHWKIPPSISDLSALNIVVNGLDQFPASQCRPSFAEATNQNSDSPEVFVLLPSLYANSKKKVKTLLGTQIPIGIGSIIEHRHGVKSGGVLAAVNPVRLGSSPKLTASSIAAISVLVAQLFPKLRMEYWFQIHMAPKGSLQARLKTRDSEPVSAINTSMLLQGLESVGDFAERMPAELQSNLDYICLETDATGSRFIVATLHFRNGHVHRL